MRLISFVSLLMLSGMLVFAAVPSFACCKGADATHEMPCHEHAESEQSETNDCCAEKFCQSCFMVKATVAALTISEPVAALPIVFAITADDFRMIPPEVPAKPPMIVS